MSAKIPISKDSALIVVDMQNDFLPDGALAVPEGDQIIDGVNALSLKFYNATGRVVFTQDWHPTLHGSFASAHNGKKPGDLIEDLGLGPILWPDHCVQNTHGAEFSPKIDTRFGIAVIRKGYHQNIDSYSTFYENDKKTKTGLAGMLKDLGITDVFLCGLALDYCVYYSAIDAKKEGFNVYVVKDLTKGIDQPVNNILKAIQTMEKNGITIITSNEFM